MTEPESYNSLSISTDNDFPIHMKRLPNLCFINNYFVDGLSAWEANLDIQPVFKTIIKQYGTCVRIFLNQRMNHLSL